MKRPKFSPLYLPPTDSTIAVSVGEPIETGRYRGKDREWVLADLHREISNQFDAAERNEELVRAVYAELEAAGPAGFRYTTFVLEDGVSFVHVAIRTGEDEAPLTRLSAFRRFLDGLAERADEPPEVRPARIVGSYGDVLSQRGTEPPA